MTFTRPVTLVTALLLASGLPTTAGGLPVTDSSENTAYVAQVPAANAVRDSAGNEADGFTDEAVTDEPAVDVVPDKMAAATFTAAGAGGFTVNWVAAVVPAGASAVTSYEVAHLVKPVDGSDPDWSGATVVAASAAATSVAVSGLTAGTAYLVRVRAANSNGSGAWSDAAEVATLDDVPNKMDAATFSSVTVSGFAVGWTAAVVPVGASAVSGYEVAHLVKPVDGSDPDWSGATSVDVSDASAVSVAVSGLTAGTAYLVRVRASNGAGSGVWSDAAEVSTAADEAVDEAVTGEVAAEAVPDKMDAATFSSVTVVGVRGGLDGGGGACGGVGGVGL